MRIRYCKYPYIIQSRYHRSIVLDGCQGTIRVAFDENKKCVRVIFVSRARGLSALSKAVLESPNMFSASQTSATLPQRAENLATLASLRRTASLGL